jgi:hypothetical protein
VPKDVPDWTTGTDIPWVPVGSFTTVGGGFEGFHTTAALVSARTLGFVIHGTIGALSSLTITGDQSNAVYLASYDVPGNKNWTWVSVNGARDSTFHVVWALSSGAGTIVDAFLSPLDMPYLSPGRQLPANSLPVVLDSNTPIGQSGQKTMALSVPVVIASDQSAVTVTPPGSRTGTLFNGLFAVGGQNLVPATLRDFIGIEVNFDASGGGAGTAIVTIEDAGPIFGVGVRPVLQSAAVVSGGAASLRVYPGIPAVANGAANDIVSAGVFVNVVVANASLMLRIEYTLL